MSLMFADRVGVVPVPQRMIDYLLAAGWQVLDDAWTRVLEGERVAGPCDMRTAWMQQTTADAAEMEGT